MQEVSRIDGEERRRAPEQDGEEIEGNRAEHDALGEDVFDSCEHRAPRLLAGRTLPWMTWIDAAEKVPSTNSTAAEPYASRGPPAAYTTPPAAGPRIVPICQTDELQATALAKCSLGTVSGISA